MNITKFKFPIRENNTGMLVFFEACKDIPFKIKRVYYIYGVISNARRGYHAHKKLQQVMICIHGSCKVALDNGNERLNIELNDPSEGLYVGNSLWREMYDFSHDAVLLVLASEYYDENDYIRDYESYKNYLKEI